MDDWTDGVQSLLRAYSTLGGISGYTVRMTIPSLSRERGLNSYNR